ncbi:malonate--CoA ligase [Flexibacterium corallicola]|uniref:malonate--CoA ligase n=1 Tax=Flexibacterium corallicola TaxID=3037259 RepID=UPI00286F7CEF|nr:malonyl-CoA synthase [Pseudovibrio sp. M1P-2-3]
MGNTLYDSLLGRFAGKTTPFITLVNGTIISHGDFLRLVARYAHTLKDTGLNVGDRVGVQIEKSEHALAVYAACLQAGFVFLPLNTAYTPEEVGYFLEDSGAKVFLTGTPDDPAINALANRLNITLFGLSGEGSGSFANNAEGKDEIFETVARSGSDLAAFLYTSGTTGRSKGAMLTHDNLLSNAKALAQYWRFSERDVLLHALPVFHSHGLFVATNVALLSGASIVLLPRFSLEHILKVLPHCTVMMGVPTFYTRLLSDPRLTRAATAHMRLFISGSAPLLEAIHVEFEARTGHRILERYGMTETNMNTSNPYEGERRAGTVGFPLPGVEIKITDPDTGASVTDGDIGMIEVRGPNVFVGYWQMLEKTKEELRPDGFFITGDLGKVDKDGYLHIVGRNKDLIIAGGYNIYPKEVEMMLDTMPGVLESAVIGVPDTDLGEKIVAILVPQAKEKPDVEAIASGLAQKLARFKCPAHYELLDELPRNTMGKVQKNVLREQFS